MSGRETVWVIDDDRSIRWVLERALRQEGMDVTSFDSGRGVLERLGSQSPDVIISDIRMPDTDGLQLLDQIGSRRPGLPVIIMTAYSDLDSTVAAYQGGAFDYLSKPFDVDAAVALVHRAVDHAAQKTREEEPVGDVQTREIIGSAPAMQEVFRAIGRLSRSSITVLITGESGTGKELVARALHRHSPRSGGPFIALNTAAIPRDLLESELFGHEKGSFTGAQSQRRGRFEQADGGTLFLDEIGDMPLAMQVKLLRVLQERTFERVGSNRSLVADVRIIAATHNDLEEAIRAGRFREDLYYRLNVFPIEMPPLRERTEDLPLLINELIARIEHEERGSIRLTPAAIRSLARYPWPGNVRELANLVERLAILYPYGVVDIQDLPEKYRMEENLQELAGDNGLEMYSPVMPGQRLPQDGIDLKEHLNNMEFMLIKQALDEADGVVAHAAKRLKMGRTTLVEKMRKYGITRQDEATEV